MSASQSSLTLELNRARQAQITREAVDGLNKFAIAIGIVKEPVAYDALVATQFRDLWNG